MSLDAIGATCLGELPQHDGHIFAQSGEFLCVASHHELVLPELSFEVFGIEVHACIDDRLHAVHLLDTIQEGFQPALELRKRAFATFLDIDYRDEVLLTWVNIRAEVLQLNECTCRRTKEVIDAGRYAYALCAV